MRTILQMVFFVAAAGLGPAQVPAVKGEPLANVAGEEFDERFLRIVMEHHRQGLELARLGAARSERTELDEFAARMSGRMEKELAELEQMAARPTEARAGLGREGGAVGSDAASSGGHDRPTATAADDVVGRHVDTMAGLRDARGEEFDRRFLQAMTKHLHAGYELNQAAAGRAGDREVAAFARRSAAEQQAEIEAMNAFYAEWFR